MYDAFDPFGMNAGMAFPTTGASLEELLSEPIVAGQVPIVGSEFGYPVVGGGGDILVGADLLGADMDGDMLAEIATAGYPDMAVGGGDILVDTGYDPLDELGIATGGDILVGAPMSRAQQIRRARLLAARRRQMAMMQQQARARQVQAQRVGQMQGIAAARRQQQFGARAIVTPDSDSKYELQPLPVDSETDINPNDVRIIRVRPQKKCKPKRMVLQDPEFWRVRRVSVGVKPQFIASGSLPGIMFAHDTTGVEFVGDTAQPGQDVEVEVQNRTGAPHRLEGAIQCHAVD